MCDLFAMSCDSEDRATRSLPVSPDMRREIRMDGDWVGMKTAKPELNVSPVALISQNDSTIQLKKPVRPI